MIVYDDRLEMNIEGLKKILQLRVLYLGKKEETKARIIFGSGSIFLVYIANDVLAGWIGLEKLTDTTYHIQVYARDSSPIYGDYLRKLSWFIIEAYKGIPAASKYFTEFPPVNQPVWILPYDELEKQYMQTKGFGQLIAELLESTSQEPEEQIEILENGEDGAEITLLDETINAQASKLPEEGGGAIIREPWKQSRPRNQKRDQVIWELREANHTWEDVAEAAECAVSTAKANYFRMKGNKKIKSG